MDESVFRNLRGLRKLMIAPLIKDTAETLLYDDPVRFAGARELSGEEEESSAIEHYDNQASIVVTSEGKDTYSIVTSILEDKIKAIIEGRKYDETKKMYFGSPKKRPYIAIGFIGEDTDGQEWYYWIYKGKLTGGAEKHTTKTDGTDSTNLEWNFDSIYTQYIFATAENKPLKFIKMKAGDITEEDFFKAVYNPDAITEGV